MHLGKIMPMCNKQHLRNIWGSIQVKQHRGCFEKKYIDYKKNV